MTVRNVTPMITVRDLDATTTFMTDILGFTKGVRMENYGFFYHGTPTNAAIRFLEARPEHDDAQLDAEQMVYIDVDDVDAIYEGNKAAFDALDDGMFRAPFNQPYRQRELHVIHGPILFFLGHELPHP